MQHILIVEDDKGRREFALDDAVYSIGRDPTCDIRLHSLFVSRRHATLVQLRNDDGSYYYRIMDGNLKGKTSANGLLINGRRLEAHDLENEDEVVFGPEVRTLYYCLGEPPNTAFPLHPLPPILTAMAEIPMREDILLYNQALVFAQEGQWREAKDLLLKAIVLRSDVAEYHALLGVVYLGFQDRKLALEQFRLAYKLDEKDPLLQHYLTFILFGEFDTGPSNPNDGFSGYGNFPNSSSPFPRNPHPLTPSTGAEASPDQGLSQTP